MGDRRFLFVWSGVCAILFYCLVISFLLLRLSSIFTTKYTPRINTAIEQSLAVDIVVAESNRKQMKDSATHLEGSGVKDIFSAIPDIVAPPQDTGDDRSKNAKNVKDRGDSSRLQSIQEQLKKLHAALNVIDNRALEVQSQNISPEFIDGEYKEWFGKIYDILYQRWESKYYQDAEVSVFLLITKEGKLRYRINRLSRYEDYNQSVIALLESLRHEVIPPYPKGRNVEVEVNFRLK